MIPVYHVNCGVFAILLDDFGSIITVIAKNNQRSMLTFRGAGYCNIMLSKRGMSACPSVRLCIFDTLVHRAKMPFSWGTIGWLCHTGSSHPARKKRSGVGNPIRICIASYRHTDMRGAALLSIVTNDYDPVMTNHTL